MLAPFEFDSLSNLEKQRFRMYPYIYPTMLPFPDKIYKIVNEHTCGICSKSYLVPSKWVFKDKILKLYPLIFFTSVFLLIHDFSFETSIQRPVRTNLATWFVTFKETEP